jgi:hypothetical protein
MEKVIELLNHMQADGVIEKYAIGGGIATIRFLEAYKTDDVDVFISPVLVGPSGLISFGAIYTYLERLGYHSEREYTRIGSWLVQFLPACEPIQEEAVLRADRVAFSGAYTWMFSAEHLAAELLRAGRRKDNERVASLIESAAVNMNVFRDIVGRYGLADRWRTFAAFYDLEQ